MNPINTGLLVTSERNWHEHNTTKRGSLTPNGVSSNHTVPAVQHPFKTPKPRDCNTKPLHGEPYKDTLKPNDTCGSCVIL